MGKEKYFSMIRTTKNNIFERNFKDSLTGLYNQRYMKSRMENLVELSKEVTLLMFDINEFMTINNFYGRDIGDEVLRHFADKLVETFGKSYDLVRRKPDKFYVIAEETLEDETITRSMNQLRLALESGFQLNDGQIVKFKFVYGVARLPKEVEHGNDLIKVVEQSAQRNKELQ